MRDTTTIYDVREERRTGDSEKKTVRPVSESRREKYEIGKK
jgi:hypothetical protein